MIEIGMHGAVRLREIAFEIVDRIRSNIYLRAIMADTLAKFGLVTLSLYIIFAVFGPYIVPYDPMQINYGPDGTSLRLESPSSDHWLGTTNLGRDVLSQTIYGARVSIIVGFTSATISVIIGTNIGLISAYVGGRVDDVLMRLTDIAYGIPLLPFAIVIVVMLGSSLINIILAIILLQWRATARVIRSQVLSHKERPYVESAEAIGAGRLRIMYIHIFPNVLPLAYLYVAFSVGWAIITEASIAFLGLGDPTSVSWGNMIFTAYGAEVLRTAWWWVFPPGISIMLLVMSVFFIGRALERPRDFAM